MDAKTFSYPLVIKETYLDSFGHVNNAVYLSLFEEARWEFISKNNYGLDKIKETNLGPTILEINIKFKREILARDQVIIESKLHSYEKKVGILIQKILKEDKECCIAEFKFGLFDTKERKLVSPTKEWMDALGIV